MIFQTKLSLQKQTTHQIDYTSKIFLVGSCFSENIATKFNYYKFQTYQNPFGILFHVKAVENLIEKAILGYVYTEKDLFLHNEQWHCFDTHSVLSNRSKQAMILQLNTVLIETKKQLLLASHIIITLGTSWVYTYIEQASIVANCHKINQQAFTKKILTVSEITTSLERIETMITAINKNTTFIYTVSPVRHLKDGFIENTLSKAHLLSAIHLFISDKKKHHYFPSYEIMMDELRDYRFYKADMLHPSQTAIDFIWESFTTNWLSEKSIQALKEIEAIQKGLNHKPFDENSQQHQKFVTSLKRKQQVLSNKYPHITF